MIEAGDLAEVRDNMELGEYMDPGCDALTHLSRAKINRSAAGIQEPVRADVRTTVFSVVSRGVRG